jgi:hypothetical protein
MEVVDMKKAFHNVRHNVVHLHFPNGASVSTIWGYGTYSDNHDLKIAANKPVGYIETWNTFMASDTCEIMIGGISKHTEWKIGSCLHRDTSGDSVIGYITLTEWVTILNLIAKDRKYMDRWYWPYALLWDWIKPWR